MRSSRICGGTRSTRWPDPAPGEPWAQGVDLDYLRDLLEYWADGFDWRARSGGSTVSSTGSPTWTACASISSFTAEPMGGGWSYSRLAQHVRRVLSLVERLGDRFDLVVPSLPGYAFSNAPADRR